VHTLQRRPPALHGLAPSSICAANGRTTFDAVYFDMIPTERLVYSYEMHMGDRKISVSLAVFELKAVGQGTQLRLTEHGAFLDGYDDAGSREHD